MKGVLGSMERWKNELTDQLCRALLSIRNEEEMYAFLEDVATIGEIQSWAQRLEVARCLRNRETYPHIASTTGASTATISRVRKFLDYGAEGYELVLSRLEAEK